MLHLFAHERVALVSLFRASARRCFLSSTFALISFSAYSQTDICPTLKQIVGLADSEFNSIKGSQWRTPNGRLVPGAWESTLAVSGAECSIHKDDGDPAFYSCTWSPSSETTAVDLAKSLTRAASNCLGVQAQTHAASSRINSKRLYLSSLDIPGNKTNSISTSINATTRTRQGQQIIQVSIDVVAED